MTAARPDEFAALTRHVEHAVAEEKRRFGIASACTEWLYKRERHKAPALPVEPIRWRPVATPPPETPSEFHPATECPRRYPGGVEDARRDFSHSQAALSIVLTFYELALVADGDDDAAYNTAELGDLIEAMVLPSVTAQLDTGAVLKATFDRWLGERNLEQIMNAMTRLYDQGYRLSAADRRQLDQVMQ